MLDVPLICIVIVDCHLQIGAYVVVCHILADGAHFLSKLISHGVRRCNGTRHVTHYKRKETDAKDHHNTRVNALIVILGENVAVSDRRHAAHGPIQRRNVRTEFGIADLAIRGADPAISSAVREVSVDCWIARNEMPDACEHVHDEKAANYVHAHANHAGFSLNVVLLGLEVAEYLWQVDKAVESQQRQQIHTAVAKSNKIERKHPKHIPSKLLLPIMPRYLPRRVYASLSVHILPLKPEENVGYEHEIHDVSDQETNRDAVVAFRKRNRKRNHKGVDDHCGEICRCPHLRKPRVMRNEKARPQFSQLHLAHAARLRLERFKVLFCHMPHIRQQTGLA
eukprot:Opistho-2@96225